MLQQVGRKRFYCLADLDEPDTHGIEHEAVGQAAALEVLTNRDDGSENVV